MTDFDRSPKRHRTYPREDEGLLRATLLIALAGSVFWVALLLSILQMGLEYRSLPSPGLLAVLVGMVAAGVASLVFWGPADILAKVFALVLGLVLSLPGFFILGYLFGRLMGLA
jgi:hypothetical protein